MAGGGGAGSAGGFHCGGTEIVVGRRAFLRMVNLQNWNMGVWHFARQKAVVHAGGTEHACGAQVFGVGALAQRTFHYPARDGEVVDADVQQRAAALGGVEQS